jgi:hypothetical protein
MKGTRRLARLRIAAVVVSAALIAVSLWACYPKRVGPVGTDGKRLRWAGMDVEQRREHMNAVVVPLAAEVFRSWRPDRYAHVDCTLCHGPGAELGDFRMPTGHLPRLSGDLFLGPEFENHRDTTRLKLDRLVPEMSVALGRKSFSLVTRSGFGCYSCHLGPDGPLYGN